MANSSYDNADFVTGWVSDSSTRGTMDIIWSSFFTIFLCTWSSICLNIPHPLDTPAATVLRKGKWMFWAVIAPKMVLSVAMGQFASARRSVRRFHRLGYPGWTLRHAFFADMGGFVLHSIDSPPFVVSSRQLAYLVENKYISMPRLTSEEIWDKSKADTFARMLTLAQASWLMIQLIGRAIAHLSITTLELFATAIVFCTLCVSACWFHKPRDIQRGINITLADTSISQILLEAGDAAQAPYRHTPLDFIAKESLGTWSYDVMGRFGMRCDNPERPLRCFPNDQFPNIGTFEKAALFCATTGFAAIHLGGWNFSFPSQTETLLWRLASAIVTGSTVLLWTFETIAARQRFGRWDKYLIWLRLKKAPVAPNQSPGEANNGDDAFEVEQKNSKPILFWEVAILLPFGLAYVVARGYMIVEALSNLRKLRRDAYLTVDFAQVLPHWH